ncbi:MAG: phosphatidylserine decarboxylase family protein [Proteobacteria bacterium]|nr:MAG: phosphatidylserine decarboxylase family protein [Pseudomonadota bacterium]
MPNGPVFRERPTAILAPEGWPFIAPLAAATAIAAFVHGGIALALGALTLFVVAFFRNPARAVPGDERTVVAPADGRVLCVDDVEDERGRKGLRIGIFLSVFDVHVNRAPLAGRVVSIERGGSRFLAAWDPRGERENVRLAMDLEIADGRRVLVTQITGLVARRIVCHARVGEWIERGARYGLIRFGSRTDVLLPPGSTALVKPGDRVRGGASRIAELEDPG